MASKYTFSLYWNLVLLGNIVACTLLAKRPSYQEPWFPKGALNITPFVQSENGDTRTRPAWLPVPTPTEADDLAKREVANSTVAVAITQPPPATTSSCPIFGVCHAYASSVFIYYWPSEAPDTSCLATLLVPPERGPPLSVQNPISPSIYAVFVSLATTDGCGQIRNSDLFTASFAPEEIATITDSSGKIAANDFGNAPCGPPGWISNGQPYKPWFNAPQALFKQFGESDSPYCVMAEIIDPPVTLSHLDGPINPPILPSNAKVRRYRKAETNARTVTSLDLQSVYHGLTSRRHPPRYITAAATAHGVPQAPAMTLNP